MEYHKFKTESFKDIQDFVCQIYFCTPQTVHESKKFFWNDVIVELSEKFPKGFNSEGENLTTEIVEKMFCKAIKAEKTK